MKQHIRTAPLPNGMTLLMERMPHVRSAAFQMLFPAGAAYESANQRGVAGVLADMMTRGAGARDSRAFSDALDELGVDRSESAGMVNMSFSGSTLSRNLMPALDLFADMLRRPMLPADELSAAQESAVQEIESLDDDPPTRAMAELRKCYYPEPLGRYAAGEVETVQALTHSDLLAYYENLLHPTGAIVSVAGDIDFDAVEAKAAELFGDWAGKPRTPFTVSHEPPKPLHVEKEIEQTQIVFAYPSVPMDSPEFYEATAAVGVLSMDMASRLFAEVREKYGLCYTVQAWHEKFRDRGAVCCYAGARPEKAQETLDRSIHEHKRLREGISAEELDRVKVGLKSSLIMRQESTGSRASALTNDWYFLGRVRPLSEVQEKISGLTVDAILGHLEKHPPGPITLVTLGPAGLKL